MFKLNLQLEDMEIFENGHSEGIIEAFLDNFNDILISYSSDLTIIVWKCSSMEKIHTFTRHLEVY